MSELGAQRVPLLDRVAAALPDRRGRRVEPRGRDHYDRLIDALLDRGIEPVVTLYHWDLPQALEDEGGWLHRDTAERFAEYAAACFDAYGDRVRCWLTINEPWIIGLLGYLHGLHAPGYKDDVRGEATAFHHVLLAHGRAVQEFRRSGGDGRIGIALSLSPHYPASDSEADREAAWPPTATSTAGSSTPSSAARTRRTCGAATRSLHRPARLRPRRRSRDDRHADRLPRRQLLRRAA